MKMKVLVIEIGIKNIFQLKKCLKLKDADILFASSFLDVVDIIHLQNVHIIAFSEFRGIDSTVGYIKMFKTTNPDFTLILLSNKKEVAEQLECYYIQRGADSLISCSDIDRINNRFEYHYDSFIKDQIIRDEWSKCTKRAIRYLKNHYHKENNLLNLVSSSINYSISSIVHSVKKDTGLCFSEWVQSLRVNGALELLKSTEYPVKQISNEVGYKSIQGLIKAFKKITGKTPNDFRR